MGFLAGVSALVMSCGNNPDPAKTSQKNKDFYPVRAFIQQELKSIDSLPVAIFLYTDQDGGTDTTIVDKSAFRVLAEAAAQPDISQPPLRDGYEETVFLDATLNLVTMSYRPLKETGSPIRKIDVYIHPGTEQVKSVYIEKQESAGDSTILEKTVWSAGKQVQMTRLISRNGQADRLENRRFSWGMQ